MIAWGMKFCPQCGMRLTMALPGTVRQIEDGAISFCADLTAISLNDGLLIIGDNCFSGNSILAEITIPSSVCYIGNNAFNSCESLAKVVFQGECPVFAGVAFYKRNKKAIQTRLCV